MLLVEQGQSVTPLLQAEIESRWVTRETVIKFPSDNEFRTTSGRQLQLRDVTEMKIIYLQGDKS